MTDSKRTTTVQVRLTPDEKAQIKQRAEAKGVKPSEFIRALALTGSAPTIGKAKNAPPPSSGTPKAVPSAPAKELESSAEKPDPRLEAIARQNYIDNRERLLRPYCSSVAEARRKAAKEWDES